jgi:hypothetical protein
MINAASTLIILMGKSEKTLNGRIENAKNKHYMSPAARLIEKQE